MKKVIFLLMVFSSAIFAQTGPPTGTSCFITSTKAGSIGDRSIMLKCTLSEANAGYDMRMNIGTSNGSLTMRPPTSNGSGSSLLRYVRASFLQPETTYYISPVFSQSNGGGYSANVTCPVTCADCDSGDDAIFGNNGSGNSGIQCTSGENWHFTTAALDDSAPVAPIPPSHTMSLTTPTPSGTFATDGTCSDFSTQLASAETAAQADGSTQAVLVPVNTRCPGFQMKALTQGIVQIRPNVNAKLLPPSGTAVHKGYYPYMGLITANISTPATWSNSLITGVAHAKNYEFIGIRFTQPVGALEADYPSSRVSPPVNVADTTFPNASNIRFDRCAFDFPTGWQIGTLMVLTQMQGLVIRDSYFRQDVTDQIVSASGTLLLSGSSDVQLQNLNMIGEINLFADTTSIQFQDVSMKQLMISLPDSHSKAHPNSDGIYRRAGFVLEFKSCVRCEFDGIFIKGGRADFNPAGPAIAFTGVGPQQGDISITNLTLKKTPSGIQFDENYSANGTRANYPTERIKLDNILMYGTSMWYNCSGSTCNQAGNSGPFLFLWEPIEDITVSRITYMPETSRRPMPLTFIPHIIQGLVFENAMLMLSKGDAGQFGVRKDGTAISGYLPTQSQTIGKPAFDEVVYDNLSSFANHVVISGLEQSNAGVYATKAGSTADSDTISRAEAAANAGISGFSGITYVGSASACSAGTCPDSLNTRLNTAFEAGTWIPKSTYTGNGADIAELNAAQGRIDNQTVTSLTSSSATINWTAPTSTGLLVQVAVWNANYSTSFSDFNTILEQTDAGGDTTETVTFTGLSAATKYIYRILGPKEIFGTFTTAGS